MNKVWQVGFNNFGLTISWSCQISQKSRPQCCWDTLPKSRYNHVQAKMNYLPKVNCRQKIKAGSANSWQTSPKYFFPYNSLSVVLNFCIHDPVHRRMRPQYPTASTTFFRVDTPFLVNLMSKQHYFLCEWFTRNITYVYR